MKRIDTMILATVALAVASCAEKPQIDAPQETQKGDLVEMTLNAVTDDKVEDTKTTYSGRNIFWEEGDAITVFFEGDGNAGRTFTQSWLSDDKTKAAFTGLGDESANACLAVYPASDAYTYDGTALTVSIPSEQVAVRNGFASGANVSVAYSSDTALKFRNVGSLIAFRFETAEDAARTASVTFRAKAATEGEYLGIAGGAAVNIQEQQPEAGSEDPVKYIPVVSGAGDATSVTLTAPEGGFEYNSTSPVTYYAVIYPGNYANGFEVTYTTNDETPQTFKLNNDETVELGRNSLLSMGAIPNPYDTLPDEITISLDFTKSVWPFSQTILASDAQHSEGDTYTYRYSYTYKGTPMNADFEFVFCKGTGTGYTHSYNGTVKARRFIPSATTTDAWIQLPGIKGRYLDSVSMSHGNTYQKRFKLQRKADDTLAYYNSPLTTATAANTPIETAINFPTTDSSFGNLKTTTMGGSYCMLFVSSNAQISNITLVYTKQAPVAE